MKNYSIDDALDLFNEDLFREIITSPEVLRLRDISFLGSIDKTEKVKKTSRFDHSIGVACLADKASEKLNIDSETKKYLIIASLLHDVGHGPLSHSLEPIIKEQLNLDHSTLTKRLIVGTYKLTTEKNNNIYKILNNHNIDPTKITSIINGNGDDFASLLFKNPFNLDTLDGINRVAFSLGVNYIDPEKIINLFFIKGDKIFINVNTKCTFDRFWDLKRHIYLNYIYNEHNLSFELLLQKYSRYMLKHIDIKEFALMDDTKLFKFFKNNDYSETMNKIITSHKDHDVKIKHTQKDFFRFDTNYFSHDSDEIDVCDLRSIYKRDSKEMEIELVLENDKIIELI
ncbi:MAG: HD domain-containing protein [Spirochaetes bacterium]|nr:HD domain-containing protein [Spirochaetota bacterium]